jgi:multiple sugar transport system permease protein/putative aldouronate transport system permease protein
MMVLMAITQTQVARVTTHRWAKSWQLYLLSLLPLVYLLVFRYIPMLGAQIAFKEYNIIAGVWGSPWVGLKHFHRFITSYLFVRIIKNTLVISLYSLAAGFPIPILLALSLNYLGSPRYKRAVQMVTYAPFFISTVVLVGMILQLLNSQYGVVNMLIMKLGGDRVEFLGNPRLFYSIFVWSGIWQTFGYSSIIYMATLSGVDPSLHEAAIVDGATIPQRIFHIDIPGIMPTAIILLILAAGRVMEVGFEKALLMQNPLNVRVAEVIDTYVYKIGLTGAIPQFSYASAIGLFKSFIGLILLVSVNKLSQKVSESSLW